ncbi:hypothetical protein HJG53_01125 [Sphingomonas sp. ID1715]|uniref:hypothetical protein n=1 Tax=Sphingomonas sp. ID1715 TaxID=1656898 RepID=UPI0014881E79|nr:hypothetical protein [Sphingomonas sp. ID1715]NNM75510.1 hypothetical protein [Sphingomonas sp. ID1715]
MIGSSLLLLIGVTGPFEGAAEVARPVAAPTTAPSPAAGQLRRMAKGERTNAVRRRLRRNDLTETLRAMNLMPVGFPTAPEQTHVQNH